MNTANSTKAKNVSPSIAGNSETERKNSLTCTVTNSQNKPETEQSGAGALSTARRHDDLQPQTNEMVSHLSNYSSSVTTESAPEASSSDSTNFAHSNDRPKADSPAQAASPELDSNQYLTTDSKGNLHIDASALGEEAIVEIRDTFSSPFPRTERVKAWVERYLLNYGGQQRVGILGSVLDSLQSACRQLYPTYNPILILQAKVGSGYSIGRFGDSADVNGWGQYGMQMNIISRGINAGDRRPIVQIFPLHTEAGVASTNTAILTVQNLGMNYVPDAEDNYPPRPDLMYERVYRMEGATGIARQQHAISATQNSGSLVVNSGAGYDGIRQLYWNGSTPVDPNDPDKGTKPNTKALVAGGMLAAAKVAGGVAGYVLGSIFKTTNEVITATSNLITDQPNASANALLNEYAQNATIINTPNSSNQTYQLFATGTQAGNGTITTDSLRMTAGAQAPTEQNWGHLGASLGSMAAGHIMAEALEATTLLRPDSSLSIKEFTIDSSNIFIDIPLTDGTNFTIGVLPRLVQFTSLRSSNGQNIRFEANEVVTPSDDAPEETNEPEIFESRL